MSIKKGPEPHPLLGEVVLTTNQILMSYSSGTTVSLPVFRPVEYLSYTPIFVLFLVYYVVKPSSWPVYQFFHGYAIVPIHLF